MSIHPLFIDNLAFAKKNERLEGDLSLAECPRLSELLQAAEESQAPKSDAPANKVQASNAESAVHYVLQGKLDSVGQHYLHLTLTANLTTTCQRCLNAMPLKLALSYSYLIGDVDLNDVEASNIEDSDDIDLQEASQAMDVIALIEDEIIMAMPIAPIHDKDCGAIVSQSGEKPNPFAVLKGLIKP